MIESQLESATFTRHRGYMHRYINTNSLRKCSKFRVKDGLFLAVFCTIWCLPCSLFPRKPPSLLPRTRSVGRRLEGLGRKLAQLKILPVAQSRSQSTGESSSTRRPVTPLFALRISACPKRSPQTSTSTTAASTQ
jgi:hypothetical protein